MIDVADYRMIQPDDWPWPHFKPEELADRSSCTLRIDPAFMECLERIRFVFDRPMVLRCGFRPPLQQWYVTARRTGAHVDGQAADIMVSGPAAYDLIGIALQHGVLGVGVQQSGPMDARYLHLDIWNAERATRPLIWSY